MPPTLSRPESDEFAPFYAPYVTSVPEGDVLDTLSTQLTETLTRLRAVPEERGSFRYQPDKWSIKEVIGHMTDTERVYTYRALRVARGDETPLSGFDQNVYVAASRAERRLLASLLDEFEAVRRATLALFRSFDADVGVRRGVANGFPVSVRALAYITAGHVQHHVRLLDERYGV